MKLRLYILTACIMVLAGMKAQNDNPLWSITSIELTSLDNDTIVQSQPDGIYQMPEGLDEVTIKFNITMSWNSSFSPGSEDYPRELMIRLDEQIPSRKVSIILDKQTQVGSRSYRCEGSCIVSDFTALSVLDKDCELAFSLTDKVQWTPATGGKIHVWKMPASPTFISDNYTTFEDETYSFEVKKDNVSQGLTANFFWEGEKNNKETITGKAPKIGDESSHTYTYKYSYQYGYRDKIWSENTITVTLTVYHLPEYTYNIVVNEKKMPDNQLTATVTHSDDVRITVTQKYGYGNASFNWQGDKEFKAKNSTSTRTEVTSSVTATNSIGNSITNRQKVIFTVTVLPEIKAERDIAEKSYLFIPKNDTKIAVKKVNDQTDLVWIVDWMLNGNKFSTTSTNEIYIPANTFVELGTYSLSALVTCYNKNNVNKKYLDNTRIVYQIEVLDEPKIDNESDISDNIVTCDGQRDTIIINGGYTDGYKIDLSPTQGSGQYGSSKKLDSHTYEITYTNSTSNKVVSEFILTVNNTIPAIISTTGAEQSVSVKDGSIIHATIYPKPKAKLNNKLDNYFYGSKMNITVGSANETSNECKWVIVGWTLDNETKNDEVLYYSETVPDGGNAESKNHKLNLKVRNIYKYNEAGEQIWAEESVPCDFTAWHPAQEPLGIKYEYEGGANTNIYEGKSFVLTAETKYGYPNGWKYIWKREGSDEILSNVKSATFVAKCLGNDNPEEQTYILTAINEIEGLSTSSFNSSKDYTVTIWRKAENFDADGTTISIKNEDNNSDVVDCIREGSHLRLEVPEAKNGYNDQWEYWWNGRNTNSHLFRDIPSIQRSDESMATEQKTYSIQIKNIGPNNIPWDQTELIEKTITVYRKPKTPTGLMKKGNGSTRTLIATMPLNDQLLQQNEYYLCFAYREASGKVSLIGEPQLQDGPGQTRFTTQVPEDIWMNESQLCAFALWHYDDGSWVTSGLRFMNDIHEEWDGSDYSGTVNYNGTTRGGETSGIMNAEVLSQDIQAIYGVNGTAQKTFVRGINIVRMIDGSVRKVIKK